MTHGAENVRHHFESAFDFAEQALGLRIGLFVAERLDVRHDGLLKIRANAFGIGNGYVILGYYGAYVSLLIVNHFLAESLPLAPLLAVLSGMGFATLGASVWGWFYVWATAFFGLAVLMVCPPFAPYGLTLLGFGWFVALLVGGIQLHFSR